MVAIDALGTTRYKHTPFYISKQKSGRPDESVTDDRRGPFDYTYRTEFYTSIVGWGGDVYHSMVLDEYWLERISTIGLLHYDLKAIMGDIVLRSARLELESNPQASPVPEPSTFLLVLLSAGLLGGGSTLKKLYRRYGLP